MYNFNLYSDRSVLGKLFDLQPVKRETPIIMNEHNEIDKHINFIAELYKIRIADVELLGEGGFGKVFKVMEKGSLAEKELKRKFNHANLLKHFKHYSSDTHYYLESECLESNLWEVRTKQKSIPTESRIWDLTYQGACGLTEMHRNKIIHRDLKLQNILLRSGSSFKVVLGDYGLAKCQETCDFVSTSGTPGFVDPALKKGSNSFDFSYDIYSFGKTLIQFILGNKFRYQYSDEMLETLIKNNVSQEISELIHRMIDRNLNQRIKLDEILSISKQHVAPEPKISEMFGPLTPLNQHIQTIYYPKKDIKQKESKQPETFEKLFNRGIAKGMRMHPLFHNLSKENIKEYRQKDPNNPFFERVIQVNPHIEIILIKPENKLSIRVAC